MDLPEELKRMGSSSKQEEIRYVAYPADVTFRNGDTKRVEITVPRKPFDFLEMERTLMAELNKGNISNKVAKVHIFRNFKEGGVIIQDGMAVEFY